MRISDWSSDVCSSDLSDATECLLHGQFQLHALKPLNSRRENAESARAARLAYRLAAPNQTAALPIAAAPAAPLIGRRAELRRLRTLWRQAALGNPPFLVVRGEAGVGKTRLPPPQHGREPGREGGCQSV